MHKKIEGKLHKMILYMGKENFKIFHTEIIFGSVLLKNRFLPVFGYDSVPVQSSVFNNVFKLIK